MSQVLTTGQTVQIEHSRRTCVVDRLLGAGGQGEVYRATVEGRAVALKWYFSHTATLAQRQGLEELIKKGPPDNRFLWPEDLAASPGTPGFGYIMPLRESRFRSIIDLMKRRVEPSFRTLATAGYRLTDSFYQLHAKGLCYRDISFGNVFFDPGNGDVLICDNDNVGYDGTTESAVLGTPKFMAPEVVCGTAKPSGDTDRYSLAVLLFYMFIVHHPLDGRLESQIRCLDYPAMKQLYGTNPVFIFDPANDTNRPVKGLHDNAVEYWKIVPTFLKNLFVRSFTEGIGHPDRRVRETEWRSAMVRLRDTVMFCARCTTDPKDPFEVFFDGDSATPSGQVQRQCWRCGKDVAAPLRLQVGRHLVMLNFDTKLFLHHIDDATPHDFSKAVAEMAQHPSRPGVWGLRNLTQDAWTATGADGVPSVVAPGRSVSVTNGTRIQFPRSVGQVHG